MRRWVVVGSARCKIWWAWRNELNRGRIVSGGRSRGWWREWRLSDVMGVERVRVEGLLYLRGLKSEQAEGRAERNQV